MTRRSRRGALAAAALVAAAACGRSGLTGRSGGPGPANPVGFGDGHDGSPSFNTLVPINACTILSDAAAGSRSVTLGALPASGAGTVFLLWQVQDALATTSTAGSAIPAYGNAGLWELVRATGLDGTTLGVATPLAHAYHSGGDAHAQACTVPEYARPNVNSGATLSASLWNGATGGIVALLVNTSLQLNGGAAIRADGEGYRGGTFGATSAAQHVTDLETSDPTKGGSKGDALDGRSLFLHGRGSIANGGGGGNDDCAGAGGGGNAGAGGLGGVEYSGGAGPDPDTFGYGGGAVDTAHAPPLRLFPGGGGGGGGTHNSQGALGASGGGVVLVIARRIANGGSLQARGGDASSINNGDGGGGGGAGGTILLITSDGAAFNGTMDARGGNGSDQGGGTNCGAGGGGGGGWVLATDPVSATCSAPRGQAGNNAQGATDGSDGVTSCP